MNIYKKAVNGICYLITALLTGYVSFFNYSESDEVPATIIGLIGTMKFKISALCVFYFFSLFISYFISNVYINEENGKNLSLVEKIKSLH